VAIPWKLLSERGFNITFTTPAALLAETDIRMLVGKNLGIWKSILMARNDAVMAYKEMLQTEAFQNPIKYSEIDSKNFDGLVLPGGHDKGVKEYLESSTLQALVVEFFKDEKPVGAICHGTVLAARSINTKSGKSVLHHKKTTCLLKSQEMAGYNMTRLWLKDYYLTYPGLTVEDEVRACLSDQDNLLEGPQPLFRDDMDHLSRGFAVIDGNYVSARWPGDAYSFSLAYVGLFSAS